MAININLGTRIDVDPALQPIPRNFIGFDPQVSDEQLWNANRGAWKLPDGAALEQFVTFSHHGTIRLVAELEGIENLVHDGEVVQALLGRILHGGDPVRDALVGTVIDYPDEVGFFDTTVQDAMLPAERYAPRERTPRTFLLTYNPDQWFWSPEDEQQVINHTRAGAIVRETWSAGGRHHGIEPGDNVFLLQLGQGVRGRGVVSSQIRTGEHWDDPSRTANYVEIDWHTILPADEMITVDELRERIPGYGWNPQKSGVELHEPMATQMHELWGTRVNMPTHPLGESDRGWAVDDSRRRLADAEARRRMTARFQDEGWQIRQANGDRTFVAVAIRDEQRYFLLGKASETAGRPVLLTAEEVAFVNENPGQCLLGQLSDAVFVGGQLVPESGELTITELPVAGDHYVPSLYRYEPRAN